MLERAFQVMGYVFKDERILAEAMTHASSAEHRLHSNERMEFLGDAVLGYVVCDHLYRNYTDLLEGDLTKIKSAVVSRRTCAIVSESLDLASMLTVGKGMSGRKDLPPSVQAGVFESVIAAIYLDGGMEAAREFILRHMSSAIDEAARSAHQHNFKSVLQHFAQKYLPGNPIYVLLDEKGPDHSKCFEVCVEIGGNRYESAWARSKKEAEQQAALRALCGLELATIDAEGIIHLTDKLPTVTTTEPETGETADAETQQPPDPPGEGGPEHASARPSSADVPPT